MHTLLLWLTPFLVLVMGVFLIRAVFRRRTALATETSAPLSEAEQKRLKSLLKDDEGR